MAAYVTRDAGESWSRQDAGLPAAHGWFTVKRQAMAADTLDPVGLYFGTTGGQFYVSADAGETQAVAAALEASGILARA